MLYLQLQDVIDNSATMSIRISMRPRSSGPRSWVLIEFPGTGGAGNSDPGTPKFKRAMLVSCCPWFPPPAATTSRVPDPLAAIDYKGPYSPTEVRWVSAFARLPRLRGCPRLLAPAGALTW